MANATYHPLQTDLLRDLMSKKHHVKKEGGSSNYPQRLADRGVSSSQVRMPFIDRQGRKHDSPDHLMKSEARRGE